MISLKDIRLSGKMTSPIVEGGKGISISTGKTAGYWARENCVGTFSGICPDIVDENGNIVQVDYSKASTISERHEMFIDATISGCTSQAKIAHKISNGNGRIHMNIMWEMAGAERILNEVLEKTRGLIHGITCGAGMPYKLAEICSNFSVYYYIEFLI